MAVTRTPQHNLRLGQLLCSEGATILEVPLIRFGRSSKLSALHAQLRRLASPGNHRAGADIDWLILTSPQAVTALFQELDALGVDVRKPTEFRWAVVGSSTAQVLQKYGVQPDFVPSQAGARHLAAELPAQPGVRALHLTSQLSEAALEAGLQRRRVALQTLELYRTLPAELDAQQRLALQSADAVTLASGSAAVALAALGFVHLPVAALGPQTAQAARTAGFTRVAQAQNATLESLVDAVVEVLQG